MKGHHLCASSDAVVNFKDKFYIAMYLGEPLNPRPSFTNMLGEGEDMHAFICHGKLCHVYGDSIHCDLIKRIGDR